MLRRNFGRKTFKEMIRLRGCETDVEKDSEEQECEDVDCNSCGSGQWPLADSCEHGSGPLSLIMDCELVFPD
jgi:hypothetical protein